MEHQDEEQTSATEHDRHELTHQREVHSHLLLLLLLLLPLCRLVDPSQTP